MPVVTLIAAPVLASVTYLLWFRKVGFSGFALLFAFIAGPFLALFCGTTVESIVDSRQSAIAAAIIGGPLVVAILTPVMEWSRNDRKRPSAGMFLLYGAVIFACSFLVLLSITLRKL